MSIVLGGIILADLSLGWPGVEIEEITGSTSDYRELIAGYAMQQVSLTEGNPRLIRATKLTGDMFH